MCKIAILENYSLFCSGIKPVLNKIKEFKVVTEARHENDLLQQIQESKPDVIIIDILHCNAEGIIPIKKIKRKESRIPILLIISKDYISHFENYITMGVNGIISSNSKTSELIIAVKKLKNGEDYFPQNIWLFLKDFLRNKKTNIVEQNNKLLLTLREISILKLFCKGLSYKEIGTALNISPRTVETHKRNILSKIKVRSTAEMINYAIQNNINY